MESLRLESGCRAHLLLGRVSCLELGGRDTATGTVQALAVPPVDRLAGRELDLLDRAPRPSPVDELGLVQPVDGLGERVVVAVALRADRADGVRVREPLRVADREVLGGFKGSAQRLLRDDWTPSAGG
jgi:hypothetical protein